VDPKPRAAAATLLLALLLAAPAIAGLVTVRPGLYWLQEDTRHSVVETIVLENSTWIFQAYTVELPADYGIEGCKGIYGSQPWDLFIVNLFPDDFPWAHEDDDPAAPLRPEFQPGGVLGDKKHGVLVMRMGEEYFCEKWLEGGRAWLNTTITIPPEAGNATITIVAAQVGGVSPVANVQYDSDLVITVLDPDAGTLLHQETVRLGGGLEGWRTITFTVPATDRLLLSLSPVATGIVPACSLCSGSWDREFIGIDKVIVEAGGSVVFYEDFILSQPPPPPTTTTPATSTSQQPQETTTTLTRTEAAPTSTTSQAEAAQSLPIPVRDGDKLVYKISLEGEGPEGKASGTGTLTIGIVVEDGSLRLVPQETDIPVELVSLAAVFTTITDLSTLVTGSPSIYELPGIQHPASIECPVLRPGGDGTVQGEDDLGYYKVRYTCTYSKGVLTSLQARLETTASGVEGYIAMEASLQDTTIQGVTPASSGLGSLTLLLAILGVLAVAGVLILVRLRR